MGDVPQVRYLFLLRCSVTTLPQLLCTCLLSLASCHAFIQSFLYTLFHSMANV
ncbi:hypothetical protein DL95DRAFT_386828 [Leptodontidium sp. 2 PMI_412]|nr:hypothetical protein DL95DRAFT_386828 [Leptodontidium sp. 2 PMI_412]